MVLPDSGQLGFANEYFQVLILFGSSSTAVRALDPNH